MKWKEVLVKDFANMVANGDLSLVDVENYCKELDEMQVENLEKDLEIESLSYSLNKPNLYSRESERLDEVITYICKRYNIIPGKEEKEQQRGKKESQQEKTLKDLLPDNLKTDEAVKIFQRAIDAKMIEMTATGLRWVQIGDRGKDTQLAYFCSKIFGYIYNGYNGNKGDRVPYTELETLFGVSRMDRATQRAYQVNKPQWWRGAIDKLFE